MLPYMGHESLLLEMEDMRATQPSLQQIVTSEYWEMPGLVLTSPQGARLWNACPQACEEVLDRLVRAGFLVRVGESYVRSDSGRRVL